MIYSIYCSQIRNLHKNERMKVKNKIKEAQAVLSQLFKNRLEENRVKNK